MKRYRILKVTNRWGESKYHIQRKHFGFLWLDVWYFWNPPFGPQYGYYRRIIKGDRGMAEYILKTDYVEPEEKRWSNRQAPSKSVL